MMLRSPHVATMIQNIARTRLLSVSLACAIVLAAPGGAAAPFAWELEGGYRDDDDATVRSAGRTTMRATYYLSAVDDATGPWELAPFLNRSSHVSVDIAQSGWREAPPSSIAQPGLLHAATVATPPVGATPPGGVVRPVGTVDGAHAVALGVWPDSGVDTSRYAVSGRYVLGDGGWFIGARAGRENFDLFPQTPVFETAMDSKDRGVFAGKYVGPGTAVTLGIGSASLSLAERHTDDFNDLAPLAPDGLFLVALIPSFETETESENLRLSIRHVGAVGGTAFSVEGTLGSSRTHSRFVVAERRLYFGIDEPPEERSFEDTHTERGREYALSARLHPTDFLGVGASYRHEDDDAVGARDVLSVSAKWFVTRRVAVDLAFARTDTVQRYGPDPYARIDARAGDSVSLRLLGRF